MKAASAANVEVAFFFDIVCPYAYLAHTRVEALCEEAGATLSWKPVLLGGIFRSIGAGEGPMATMAPPRAANNSRNMQRWAEYWEVPLHMPSAHPQRTVLAMRTITACPEPVRAAKALYNAYWRDGRDVTAASVVTKCLEEAGLQGAELVAQAARDETKLRLRKTTDEAVQAGVFGVPTYVISSPGRAPALVWGQDRLPFLSAAIGGALRTETP